MSGHGQNKQSAAGGAQRVQRKPGDVVSSRQAAIDGIRGRNWFYWMRNTQQQKAVTYLGAALLLSLAMNGYQVTRDPVFNNIAMDEMGRMLPVYPLSEPVLDRAEITNLAAQCVMRSLTFNFRHYRHELDVASRCFTDAGWEAFLAEISREGGLLDRVVKGNLIATANLRAAAVLTKQGTLNGRHAWVIQIPLVVTVEKEGARATDQWLAEVTMVRVSQMKNVDGAAIDQIVIKRGGDQ